MRGGAVAAVEHGVVPHQPVPWAASLAVAAAAHDRAARLGGGRWDEAICAADGAVEEAGAPVRAEEEERDEVDQAERGGGEDVRGLVFDAASGADHAHNTQQLEETANSNPFTRSASGAKQPINREACYDVEDHPTSKIVTPNSAGFCDQSSGLFIRECSDASETAIYQQYQVYGYIDCFKRGGDTLFRHKCKKIRYLKATINHQNKVKGVPT